MRGRRGNPGIQRCFGDSRRLPETGVVDVSCTADVERLDMGPPDARRPEAGRAVGAAAAARWETRTFWGFAVMLALTLALSGCQLGPRYKGPPATALANFHNSAAVENRQTALAAPPVDTWWTGF